ncbi:UTP--glucose-1-phosphate uridylyltransferase GalU [Maricaulis sp.]|uniref:UTP--glucose-1-phosphate uridylyltransferase GalU n=1 Tax=Maricaulis sp. TaxID=1486257 RepID=UPI0025C4FC25|nr:UTP--glucose-1-phosphate uridylyltransferase GalU [Maricaulis sp.]
MTRVRKAVLPVAGFGTRVLPATKTIPKEMLPVFDRPAIQYVVDEAVAAGIEHFVFVTGRNKGAIEDYFDTAYELEASLEAKGKSDILAEVTRTKPIPGSMSFVRQQAPLGLGHAIWCARDIIGSDPFAILLPDVLVQAEPSCLAQMISVFDETGGNVIAVEQVPADEVNKYGIIDPESREGNRIRMRGMVEKPAVDAAPSNLSITGRYILQGSVFDYLADQAAGAGGEIQLTDAMARQMQNQDFHAVEYVGQSYDCGSKLGYLRATMAYARAHRELGDGAQALINEFSGN